MFRQVLNLCKLWRDLHQIMIQPKLSYKIQIIYTNIFTFPAQIGFQGKQHGQAQFYVIAQVLILICFAYEVYKGCHKSEVFDMELHVDMPRPLLQVGPDVLIFGYFGKATVLLDGDSALVWLATPKAKVAIADLDFLTEHIGPEKLALVGAKLALSEGSQFQDRKHSKTVLYFDVLIVVDASVVGAAADDAQPFTLHFF